MDEVETPGLQMLIETDEDCLLIMLKWPTCWVSDNTHSAICISRNPYAVRTLSPCRVNRYGPTWYSLCLLFWRTLLSRSLVKTPDIVQVSAGHR